MSKCPHEEKVIPIQMTKPRTGVVGLVECKHCHMVIGNCRWVQTGEGNATHWHLKFSPEALDDEMNPEADGGDH